MVREENMNKFSHLFSPIKVGNFEYRNRIEAAPTLFASVGIDGFAQMGFKLPVDRTFRMIEDRAKGGCASVVIGEIGVNSQESKRLPFESDVNFSNLNGPIFASFQRYARVIKKHNAIAIAELVHSGSEKETAVNGIEPIGPVEFTKPNGTHVRPFDRESMDKVINDYITATKFMKAAGFDGALLHYGHGWLAGQFLSPATNTRTDEYGGSLKNRARYPLEVLRAVKEAMGKDFLIEIRVSGEDHMPNGIKVEETAAFCKMAEPYVDLIHVSGGHYFSPARTGEFSSIYAPHALHSEFAAIIKQGLSIPVAVVGGINSPEHAEELIASGKVDIVALGRQMFADPDFANKARDGKEDEIRRCVRCCICYPGPLGEHETEPNFPKGYLPPLGSCSINPYNVWAASFHTVLPEDMEKPAVSRKVLIVGGGMAGMQAAITASDRGHNVTLAEKSDKLGGILKFTDMDPLKKDLFNFKELLIREVNKRQIHVELNKEINVNAVKSLSPDVVIIAVGSDDAIPPIPGIENARTALSVYFADCKELGKEVIVLGGGLVGCETALYINSHNIKTTVLEMQDVFVPEMVGIYRTALMDEMKKAGVIQVSGAKVVQITANSVTLEKKDGLRETFNADSIVVALGRKSNSAVAQNLKDACGSIPAFIIGDCVRPARIGEAIQEAWQTAMQIL